MSRLDAARECFDRLSDKDVLIFHREVCRRAAAIYEPLYREKREANWKIGQGLSRFRRSSQES